MAGASGGFPRTRLPPLPRSGSLETDAGSAEMGGATSSNWRERIVAKLSNTQPRHDVADWLVKACENVNAPGVTPLIPESWMTR